MTIIAKLPARAVLEVSGEDARSYLQGLLTNDVRKVSESNAIWAGLLSPQGKYLFDMLLIARGDGLLLDTEAARAAELAKRLTLFKLRAKVEIKLRPDLAVFAGWDGPAPAGAFPDPRLAALGWRFIGENLDATASAEDYDRRRLALGVPDGSRDIAVDQMLWLEANADELNGVDYAKGCYVGQENTARMHHRNKVRKRLLSVEGDLTPGAKLMAGEREAGEVRSVHGRSGLALMRMEYVEQGVDLSGGVRVILPEYLSAKA